MAPDAVVRFARPEDVEALAELVRDLADYERSLDRVRSDSSHLAAALFGEEPKVFSHVAELDGEVVGMSMWFLTFSTWTGRHGIWLEDLYVRPEARRLGLGKALLAELARVASARGYTRVEWSVLNWNAPSIEFYRSLGALPLDDWTVFRLEGADLEALGGDPLG